MFVGEVNSTSSHYTIFFFLNLFLAVSGLSCGMRALHCGAQAPRCSAQASIWLWYAGFLFSSCGVQAPGRVASVVVVHGYQSVWAL